MSVHLCNTFFEQELEEPTLRPPLHWLRSHPIFLQLQFLPLLDAAPEDTILVSDLPPEPDPRLKLLSDPLPPSLTLWGPPCTPLVRQLNSKVFSFTHAPQLPGSALLATEQEVHAWIARTEGPKVLKTSFGNAGRGHFHVGTPGLERFLQKQFARGLPLIGEPWVQRLLDFSTQWHLSSTETEQVGTTVFENSPRGMYVATYAGPDLVPKWALEEHLRVAKPLVCHMQQLGYRGNVGVDAFIYHTPQGKAVHPVVEINGRKTMSWVALHIQQTQYPNQTLRFWFGERGKGALPQILSVRGKTVVFPKQISYELVVKNM